MKAFAILLGGLILLFHAALGAQAATPDSSKRVALVIGNSKYVNAVALPNPANDAHLIASTLRNAGFEVIEGVDQDNAGMHSLISKFTEESYNADLAVIFYAGHGMQVDGKNYLIPVDAELTSPAYLKTRTVQIDEFMAALPADPAVGIIILDACRDNPLARTLAAALPKSRSLGAGLAPVDAKADGMGTGGVLIAYATDPGAIAFDGNGVDSPYSLALAKHLTEPGVEIQSALTRVRRGDGSHAGPAAAVAQCIAGTRGVPRQARGACRGAGGRRRQHDGSTRPRSGGQRAAVLGGRAAPLGRGFEEECHSLLRGLSRPVPERPFRNGGKAQHRPVEGSDSG